MRSGTLSEYAAHKGVSAPYVTKLKKAGRIVFVEVGGRQLVNFDLTDRLVANTADLGRSRNGEHGRGRAAPSVPETRNASPAGDADENGDRGRSPAAERPESKTDSVFRQAQAKERVFSAMTAELTYKKLIGELVDRAAAERTVFDAFRALRDQAFQAPQRAAARCMGVSDMREIERIFADELRKGFAGWEEKTKERFAARGK